MIDEQAVLFGREQTMVGVLTTPAGPRRAPGVAAVFINAGVVHRVGPNRIYVRAARLLAERGLVSVRFDLSGIGDSPASLGTAPFEQAAVGETRDVLNRLQEKFGIERFVLLGICSGAVVSFRTALADDRVAGAVLINPQGLGGGSDWNVYVRSKGRARRLLRDNLLALRSWRRALTGQSDYRLVMSVVMRRLRSWRGPGPAVAGAIRELAADFERLRDRGVRLLLSCSEDDEALDYLREILGPDLRRMESRSLSMQMLPLGDHSLTMKKTQEMFLGSIQPWVASLLTPDREADTVPAESLAEAARRSSAAGGLTEGAV